MIVFGRSVIEKVGNQTMLCFPHLTYLLLQHYLAKEETQKTEHWCNTLQLLQRFRLFLLNHAPNSPELNALIARFRVIQQREYES